MRTPLLLAMTVLLAATGYAVSGLTADHSGVVKVAFAQSQGSGQGQGQAPTPRQSAPRAANAGEGAPVPDLPPQEG